ncbi:hypothetical protein KN815_21585 [Streptomyces sp. 4503]|uniref:Uncharacterized protein n=1 Tax=Streptomyces niphimycinicus TaxID=2842201 RepID=A0ABS6CI05_9ACTN|nr:hypothetical protein [Streptomyces niphimycinicus]MBU3866562.1 hypothetical protein [Streptomyces niphimycinicus]
MRIDVAVDGGEAELRSLLDWLRRDPAARRGAHVELVQAEPSPGQMGALTDVLQLVTENAWSAASFALALSTWRQTRPHARRITVRRGDLTVDIAGGDGEELRRLIDALERPAAPDPDPDPDRQADGGGR